MLILHLQVNYFRTIPPCKLKDIEQDSYHMTLKTTGLKTQPGIFSRYVEKNQLAITVTDMFMLKLHNV